MKKLFAILLAATMIGSVVTGCGSNNQTSDNSGTSDNSASNNGDSTGTDAQVLNTALGKGPANWDPCDEVNTSTAQMYNQVYGLLYRSSDDGEVPSLAESYTVNDDGTVYTFKLREGLTFADGSALTANDFEYTYKRAMDPEVADEYAWFLCDFIKGGYDFNGLDPESATYEADYTAAKDALGIKALDDTTLEFTLEAPAPYFLNVVAQAPYGVMSEAFIEALGDTPYGQTLETSLFSGPFVVSAWQDEVNVTMSKNDNYYDAENVILEEVNFSIIADASTELMMYESGQIDLTGSKMNVADAAAYAENPEYHVWEVLNTAWACFNVEQYPFDDALVRQALVAAIDYETIAATVIGGGTKAATGLVPGSMPNPANPSEDWRDDQPQATTADPDKAIALLEEAGWTRGADGAWSKNGEAFPTVSMNYNNKTTMDGDIANAMIGYWNAIGIQGVLDPMESALRSEIRPAGEFMITWMGWTADYADAYTFLDCLSSDHNYNYGRFYNDEYDALINTAETSLDQQERYDAMIAAENILMEEMPILAFANDTKTYLEKPYVKGITRPSLGTMDLSYAYIEGK